MGERYRAGAIGHTGRGNYGHLLEMAFQGLERVDFVAIADPDPEGRAAAGERTGARRLYADYRRMLAAEDLDLVSVCPRLPDCHAEMVIACAEAGARGLLIEKPLAPTLREADALLEACRVHGVKTAVAHRRANPYEQYGKKLVDEGAIGRLQVLRGHGKADHRAGSQDLMVLGTHMMDSMRYFAGADVAWVHGHVTEGGREVALEDVRQGDEGIGPIAGDGVAAYFAFENGVTAHYESYRGDTVRRLNNLWFGFEVYGTEGIIALRDSPRGEMYIYRQGLWIPGEENGRWERVLLNEWERFPASERTHQSNLIIVRELIRAIEEDRPVRECSSGEDGRAALEMIMAVHESQRLGARVSLPLANRENPYETWRRKHEEELDSSAKQGQ